MSRYYAVRKTRGGYVGREGLGRKGKKGELRCKGCSQKLPRDTGTQEQPAGFAWHRRGCHNTAQSAVRGRAQQRGTNYTDEFIGTEIDGPIE